MTANNQHSLIHPDVLIVGPVTVTHSTIRSGTLKSVHTPTRLVDTTVTGPVEIVDSTLCGVHVTGPAEIVAATVHANHARIEPTARIHGDTDIAVADIADTTLCVYRTHSGWAATCGPYTANTSRWHSAATLAVSLWAQTNPNHCIDVADAFQQLDRRLTHPGTP